MGMGVVCRRDKYQFLPPKSRALSLNTVLLNHFLQVQEVVTRGISTYLPTTFNFLKRFFLRCISFKISEKLWQERDTYQFFKSNSLVQVVGSFNLPKGILTFQ